MSTSVKPIPLKRVLTLPCAVQKSENGEIIYRKYQMCVQCAPPPKAIHWPVVAEGYGPKGNCAGQKEGVSGSQRKVM